MTSIYSIQNWLNEFERVVNARDYEQGLSMYGKSAVMFGTRVVTSSDVHEYAEKQWRLIWNSSHNFKFSNIVQVIELEDLKTCAVLWTNTTVIGKKVDLRMGRATFIFQKYDRGLVAVHSHFSESPVNSH